jgi:hypothetical protein
MTPALTPTGFRDRDLLVEYLHTQLVGPAHGPDETLDERPQHRYLTGVLYPVEPERDTPDELDPLADEDIQDESPGQFVEDDEDPVTLAGQLRPSSVGFSFVTDSWSPLVVEVEFGRYDEADPDGLEVDPKKKLWRRQQVTSGPVEFTPDPVGDSPQTASRTILPDRRVCLETRWRPHGDGAIVTVALVNRQQQTESSVSPADCLFQVVVRCRLSTGEIRPYPNTGRLLGGEEERELELLYRNVPVYAVGHGAATEWDRETSPPAVIRTSFLPVHVVPDIEFSVAGSQDVLQLRGLMNADTDPEPVLAGLRGFVDNYALWVSNLRAAVRPALPKRLGDAADRLLERMGCAEQRMRRGIDILADPANTRVRRAFALANRAMLMQMAHSTKEFAGSAHPPKPDRDVMIDYEALDHEWRPFQLGFLLLTLEGTINERSPERDLVDLVWFPTGGGKTEAYLLLAAFTILHRRLERGDDGAGTTVITRYTLRLLTTQQFQRAATMIAACETLRKAQSEDLGSTPISIGVWVGGDNSPNSYAKAAELLARLKSGNEEKQGFQIELCPWCGARIVPGDPDDEPYFGIVADNSSFRVLCPNGACPFSDGIPVSSVDEDLYRNPPTMLVGTVDKFARMAWDSRTGVFLGAGGSPGPSLIIQDEFHLISGPLGTIVGLYEAAFDVVMRHNSLHPKIVAATATIRRAKEQVRGVFGRGVALFPPAGLDADDSYFVRTTTNTPGRAYVGLMPQGHTPLTALVHLAAAQLQALVDERQISPTSQDAYWTLVAYHNSLRELGKTVTLAHDDIPARIKVIARAENDCRALDDDRIVELTSNVPPVAIPRILRQLSRTKDHPRAVSFVASTNMLSVGVDVSRLGLMTVVGQPKTTAEYIQATSRVGRDKSRPGLVVTLYSPSKPRDRSHYESFVPYHESLYSSVEPTSVTPFSVPARLRALHADLVVVVRHALGLADEGDAASFDPTDPEFKKLLDDLCERARSADDEEYVRTCTDIARLVDEWAERVTAGVPTGGLVYHSRDRRRVRLIKRFNQPGDSWPTLDSMRSVDVEVRIQVDGTRT